MNFHQIAAILFFLCPALIFAQLRYNDKLDIKIDSILSANYDANKPGVAIHITKDGKSRYSKQIGLANIENNIPISDSTAFHIASVSKQFTGYLAVVLEQEKKLSLADDIKKYLPELKNLPYKITIRQLANHTHGLPNLFELAQLKGISISDRMTHKEVVNMLLKIKNVNFKAGDKYEYNNTGFVLLAEIIERVSGKPFQEVLNEKIFIPLGMKNTQAVDDPSLVVKNKANSYKLISGTFENYPFNIMANGSSGISTTINDLALWSREFQNPNLHNKRIFDEMQKFNTLNSKSKIDYGLGLQLKNYKGVDLVFHGGGDAAYRSYILHIPKHNFSIVLLSNTNDFAPLKIIYEIVDLFYNKIQKKNAPPVKAVYSSKELKNYEGTYQMFPGTYYNIIAENEKLYFQSYGKKDKALLPIIGDDIFSFPYIPGSKFEFYNGGFNFYIADFIYPCTKLYINPPNVLETDLDEFRGIYKNEELNTFYELVIENKQLTAVHAINKSIKLNPLSKDIFYATTSFFGKLDFIRNFHGKIVEFQLSGQNLTNLKFIKLN